MNNKKGKGKKKILILIILLLPILSLLLIFAFPMNKSSACLSLTFDDGYQSHYNIVYPLLYEKNFSATFFIIVNKSKFENKELMSSEQIKYLAEQGFEIGSHTLDHPFLTDLSEKEIENEMNESKKLIEENYNIEVESLAFPYSKYNEKTLSIAEKYYLNLRNSFRKNKKTILLDSYGLQRNTSAEVICENINLAKNQGQWLILIFHDISDNPQVWDSSIYDFKKILKCTKESGIVVDSIKQCRKKYF